MGENGSFKDHCGWRDHMTAKMLKPDRVLKIIPFYGGLPLVRTLCRAIRQKCYCMAVFLFSRGQW